eukprot:6250711-Pyramimonas_sp.AAC.1
MAGGLELASLGFAFEAAALDGGPLEGVLLVLIGATGGDLGTTRTLASWRTRSRRAVFTCSSKFLENTCTKLMLWLATPGYHLTNTDKLNQLTHDL